jgi:hypothetical protein
VPTFTLKKLLALIGIAALLLSGCAGSNDQQAINDDPEAALQQALDNFADYEGITVELTLESTPDSLSALSEGELTDEQARQILDSSFVFTTKEAEDPKDSQLEMVGNIAGQDRAFEVKVLGLTLYVRADVNGLVETFGADSSEIDALRQQYGSQPGFEFIGTLLDGEWVALTGFQEFAEQMTGQPLQSSPSAEQRDLSKKLAQSLEDNSSVEAGNKEGPGGHLLVSLNVQDLYTDFKSLAETTGGLATGGAPLPDPSDVPDRDLLLDVWVDDEQITQVELDITQFADWEGAEDFPEGIDDFRLRLALEEFIGDVAKPEAADEVDLAELMQLFMGGGLGSGGATGSGSGGPSNAELCNEIESSLEGQPDEVIEQARDQFGAMCPRL